MQIEEYLSRYDNYRKVYENMQRVGKIYIEGDVADDGIKYKLVNTTQVLDVEMLKNELRRRERILRYATARLQAAISRIGDTAQMNYLMCRYFYGMKNSDIATVFSYCERHVYRLAAGARQSLYRELVKLMPKPRRGERGKVYRYSRKIKRVAV